MNLHNRITELERAARLAGGCPGCEKVGVMACAEAVFGVDAARFSGYRRDDRGRLLCKQCGTAQELVEFTPRQMERIDTLVQQVYGGHPKGGGDADAEPIASA